MILFSDYKGTGAKPKNIKHVNEVGTSISVSTSSSSKAGQKSTDNSEQIPVACGEQQSVEIKKSSEQIAEAKLIEDSIKAILHSQSQLFNFVPANQASEVLPVTDTQYQALLDNSVPEVAELRSLEFLKNITGKGNLVFFNILLEYFCSTLMYKVSVSTFMKICHPTILCTVIGIL